ncbi:winged helix-turn-helix domain-containing protein [Micromonospora sp. NPDC049102]|uniref:winged helix-turn-helix domain-containing protein n=1 Tax=Micromonospora sp. NPDC049102 TaxID=3364265 RepID=UPI00371CD6B3
MPRPSPVVFGPRRIDELPEVDVHPNIENLVNDIIARIDRNEFLPGSRLPSRRELAEQYAVAQSTVNQAVRELVERRVLVGRPGVGVFVAEAEKE